MKHLLWALLAVASTALGGGTSSVILSYRGSTDPSFASVVALLHLNGANGSTSFPDVIAANTWTPTGSVTIATAQSVFGGASMTSPTTFGSYIETPSNAKFGYGTADFTIEFRMRIIAIPAFSIIYDQRTAVNQDRPTIYLNGSSLRYFAAGVDRINGPVMSINTWYAIAISSQTVLGTRTTRLFVDGSSVGSFVDSFNYVASHVLVMQAGDTPSLGFQGYIDELRITKGVARYGAAGYTPATAQFPDM